MLNEETARVELRAMRQDLEGLQSRLNGLLPDFLLQHAVRPRENAASDSGTAPELHTIIGRLTCESLLPLLAGLTALAGCRAGAESVSPNVMSLALPSWDEIATLVQAVEERVNALRDLAMNRSPRTTQEHGAR